MNSLLAKTGAVAVLGLGLALAAQAPTLAAETQTKQTTIAVNPATQLPAVANVGVAASELEPNAPYYVQQCAPVENPPTDYACDPNTRVRLEADETGALSTPLTVNKEYVGYRGNGEYVPVDCSAVQCVVAVSSMDGQGFTTAPITFEG